MGIFEGEASNLEYYAKTCKLVLYNILRDSIRGSRSIRALGPLPSGDAGDSNPFKSVRTDLQRVAKFLQRVRTDLQRVRTDSNGFERIRISGIPAR